MTALFVLSTLVPIEDPTVATAPSRLQVGVRRQLKAALDFLIAHRCSSLVVS
jgi:hypothetical protein